MFDALNRFHESKTGKGFVFALAVVSTVFCMGMGMLDPIFLAGYASCVIGAAVDFFSAESTNKPSVKQEDVRSGGRSRDGRDKTSPAQAHDLAIDPPGETPEVLHSRQRLRG